MYLKQITPFEEARRRLAQRHSTPSEPPASRRGPQNPRTGALPRFEDRVYFATLAYSA